MEGGWTRVRVEGGGGWGGGEGGGEEGGGGGGRGGGEGSSWGLQTQTSKNQPVRSACKHTHSFVSSTKETGFLLRLSDCIIRIA